MDDGGQCIFYQYLFMFGLFEKYKLLLSLIRTNSSDQDLMMTTAHPHIHI